MRAENIAKEIFYILENGGVMKAPEIQKELTKKGYRYSLSSVRAALYSNPSFEKGKWFGEWKIAKGSSADSLGSFRKKPGRKSKVLASCLSAMIDSAVEAKVISYLQQKGKAATPQEIADNTGYSYAYVFVCLRKSSQVVKMRRGIYALVSHALAAKIEAILLEKGPQTLKELSSDPRLHQLDEDVLEKVVLNCSSICLDGQHRVRLKEERYQKLSYPDFMSFVREQLSEREYNYFRLYFGIDCERETYQQIGDKNNTTRQRVEQIIRRGERKIRVAFDSPGILGEPLGTKFASLLSSISSKTAWAKKDFQFAPPGEARLIMTMMGFREVDESFTKLSMDDFRHAGNRLVSAARNSASGRLSFRQAAELLPEGATVEDVTSCFIKTDSGYVLKKRTIRHLVVSILEQSGKPMRFEEILPILRSQGFMAADRLAISHNERKYGLLSLGDGRLSLKKWKIPAGTLIEHVTEILRDNPPLTSTEIQERVAARRENNKSIKVFVVDSDKFVLVGWDKWTLKEKASPPYFHTPMELMVHLCRTTLEQNPGYTKKDLLYHLARITGQDMLEVRGTLNFRKLLAGTSKHPVFNENWKKNSPGSGPKLKPNSLKNKVSEVAVACLTERGPTALADLILLIQEKINIEKQTAYGYLTNNSKIEKFRVEGQVFYRLKESQ